MKRDDVIAYNKQIKILTIEIKHMLQQASKVHSKEDYEALSLLVGNFLGSHYLDFMCKKVYTHFPDLDIGK